MTDARFDGLLQRLGAISELERAGSLLAWDEETKMPPLGAATRAEQRATIARVEHELATAAELGELLDELRGLENDSDPDSFEACVLRVARRDYERERRVPPELKAELTRASSHGYTPGSRRGLRQTSRSSARNSSAGLRSQRTTSPATRLTTTPTTSCWRTTSPGCGPRMWPRSSPG